MLRFYREVDLPDTCYIQEVAYWIAFGRVPEWRPYGDENDARKSAEALLEYGGILDYDYGYSEAEFALAGVAIHEWDRYQNAKLALSGTAEESLRNAERYTNVTPAEHLREEEKQEVLRYSAVLAQEYKADAKELEWATSIDEEMEPIVERARLKVLQALSSGELKATGWVDRQPDNEETRKNIPNEEYGDFVEIPAGVWTYRRFDWQSSQLETTTKTYRVVQIETSAMLAVFPSPHCESIPSDCAVYPGVAILSRTDETRTSVPLRRKGRPALGDGLIGVALQNWARDRMMRGELPAKREAVWTEGVAWVRQMFERDIGRTTVQGYLRPVLPDAGAHAPKNAA